jgi:hypothetical protein
VTAADKAHPEGWQLALACYYFLSAAAEAAEPEAVLRRQ